jgi:D-aminoacyl-tRNA deacylase
MRALIQRVRQASVSVEENIIGEIAQGLLVFLAVQKNDSEQQADKLLQKIINYRVFSDQQQKMNLSLSDVKGDLLLVSQFTLAADTQKGLRPGFSLAAEPQRAQQLFNYFVAQARAVGGDTGIDIATGQFGADMQVSLTNDGPVTFLLDVN